MKQKKTKGYIQIVIPKGVLKCGVCLRYRKDEPYALFFEPNGRGGMTSSATCWRCCRDAESTFLIQQKWPLAFDVVIEGNCHRLEWSPGVKALIGNRDEVQTSD